MKRHSSVWKISLVLNDACAVTAGFLLAYWLRFTSGWIPAPKGTPPLAQHLGYLLFVLMVWLALFRSCGLYRQRVQGPIDEAYSIAVGVAVGSIALLGAAYWQEAYWYSRGLLILAALLSAVLMLLGRLTLRSIWRSRYERGCGTVDAILIGEANDCARVAAALSSSWTGYRVLGRARPLHGTGGSGQSTRRADDPSSPAGEIASDTSIKDLGSWSTLLDTLCNGKDDISIRAQEIILIGNCLRATDAQRLADACDGCGVVLRFVPDVLDIVKRQSPVEEVAGVPLLTLSAQPVSLPGQVAKRALDLVIALPLTLVLAPLMAAIAAAVKWTSAGPVFYSQERCGRDGRPFNILKFRSMSVDAERDGARWATRGDTRVTPVGRWLRRTSLDELPQLFNVLCGDMSLVGPRPERPIFVEQFGAEIPRYHERHRVPVGITGWAQVNGLRGDTPVRDRTLYDLYYVENWSVALDLKILLKTTFEVLFHREAY
jgi:putative colanic acid biosynthesis UDP-glucose lipid carrier transferase